MSKEVDIKRFIQFWPEDYNNYGDECQPWKASLVVELEEFLSPDQVYKVLDTLDNHCTHCWEICPKEDVCRCQMIKHNDL